MTLKQNNAVLKYCDEIPPLSAIRSILKQLMINYYGQLVSFIVIAFFFLWPWRMDIYTKLKYQNEIDQTTIENYMMAPIQWKFCHFIRLHGNYKKGLCTVCNFTTSTHSFHPSTTIVCVQQQFNAQSKCIAQTTHTSDRLAGIFMLLFVNV